jgi:hypothetical protein
MTRLTVYIVALSLGAAAAIGLVSCGGSDDELLPGSSADQILDNLDTVEELVAAGDCDGAVGAAQEVRNQVDELPRSVDAGLRQRLLEGAEQLEEVAATDCEEPVTITETTEPTEDTETQETEPDEDDEDEQTTAPTETEPTETVPTDTEPTETEPPTTPTDGEDGGSGGSGGIGPGGSSRFQPGGSG